MVLFSKICYFTVIYTVKVIGGDSVSVDGNWCFLYGSWFFKGVVIFGIYGKLPEIEVMLW